MTTTLKNIIKNSDDLYLVKVTKPDKHDRTTWDFSVIDSRWTSGSVNSHMLQTVHLRRDNNFFIAYKSYKDDNVIYFVDPQKAMYRKSIRKYVNSQVDYSIHTNDISKTKNDPSFRITSNEMKSNRIDNFLDLCYEYREYSAIGTGYTRNVRNLVVMDIDVDCTKPENKNEIDNLLLKFSSYNALPDFYIFNHDSNHIQLQWLIQDFKYKDISKEIVDNITNEISADTCRNKELNYRGTDFTKITKSGIDYRRFTLALCDIVKKRKFGDKNYTFWKAKNPMSALEGYYNLELFIPYLSNGKISYIHGDEAKTLFSTKFSRQLYFEEAPTITDLYKRTKDFMDPLVKKVTEKKALKLDDAEDVTEIKIEKHQDDKKEKDENSETYGSSRNTFVLRCTQLTTWETAKSYGFKLPEHITRLEKNKYIQFRLEVFKQVKNKFDEENKKYNGVWPGTTNKSSYSSDEFKRTFDKSFNWAVQNYKCLSYSNDDRKKSLQTRINKKNIKIITVDKIRSEHKDISRNKLLEEVNKILQKNGEKQISMGSLKRYISESKNLTLDERMYLYNEKNT